jgi:hypothetical protein
MKYNASFQCEHCGQPLAVGHNCNGVPFVPAPSRNSIPATGNRKEILRQKGFYEVSDKGDVYYDHPVCGRVCIYPGGAVKILFVETGLPVDKYLESLNDSSYTVIEDADTYTARCGVCGEEGNPFPVELGPPFPHKANCPQGKSIP